MAGPTQPPFYVPRFEPTFWQGEPVNSAVLQILTAGGKPKKTEWAARTTYIPPPDWVWTAPPSDTLRLLTFGGKPKKTEWAATGYTYVPPSDWLGKPVASNIRTIPVTTAPFSNYCCGVMLRGPAPDQFWTGAPIGAPFEMLGGQVPTKRWRYDYDSGATLWQGVPRGASFNALGGQVPTKQWRWDYVPEPVWQGKPQSTNVNTFAAAAPFFTQWRYDLTPSPDWVSKPLPSSVVRLLTAGGNPAHQQWRYDWNSGAAFWQGSPRATNVLTLAQTAPFHTQWRYDYDSGRTWWQGAPIGVHSPIFNPGPPIPPIPPTTTGGGELPRGGKYQWNWRDFNDRAWLKAFRDEFYRARKRRNAERRREELEELDRILAAATAQPTTIEQKYDLQRAGELLLSTAALGTERYDRITENLTALAAEIDDEEAFILLSD